MQLSHIHVAHVHIAYFTHVSGMILYAMAIEHVELHVEFRDRLQTLIDCAHGQNGKFHDRWRQNSDSRRPFDAHLRIHYHLQLLSHPRLQLISMTKS